MTLRGRHLGWAFLCTREGRDDGIVPGILSLKTFPTWSLWGSQPHLPPAGLYQPWDSLSGVSLTFSEWILFIAEPSNLHVSCLQPWYSHLTAGKYCTFITCLFFSNFSCMHSTLRARITEDHLNVPLVASLAFSYISITVLRSAGAWGWALCSIAAGFLLWPQCPG